MSFLRTSARLTILFTLGLCQSVVLNDSAIANSLRANSLVSLTNIQLAQASNVIFVSPNGSDTNTGLSADQPLKSITAAISRNLPSGSIVQLANGTYSSETGEQFPIKLPSGVTLRGNPANQGQEVIILGGGVFVSPTFARQNITMLAENSARIEGVTFTNPNPRGYALWLESAQNVNILSNTFTRSTHDGVFLTGETSAVNVTGNIFTQNGANGLSALGTSTGKIESNTFDNTGFGIAIGQNSKVAIASNRITNNRGGIVISNLSMPSLRNNLIANNQENGLVILKDRKGQPTVDLGSSASPGQNIFQNNKQADINNASGITIVAIGNQAEPKLIKGSVDLTPPTSPLTPPSTPALPITQIAFADVPKTYWAEAFIRELASRDIIKGFPDGSFRPNEPVTRAQFAAILSQAMNKPNVRSGIKFTDVQPNFWANTAIQKAFTTGFMSGYSATTFRPSENISRVQILVSLSNGLGYKPSKSTDVTLKVFVDNNDIPKYALNSVAAASENRIVVNYPSLSLLRPNQTATRAEVAAFIYQALVSSGKLQAISSPYIANQ
ncbi:MAG: hypothetical protein DCE90_16185 [Pseudanabaena sp.]|nr:MAG: hypothetical protein DCE90_16185 [Pseudanabaena sp.]